jgi:hypothetical protein
MRLKDPHELLASIDLDRWDSLRGVSKFWEAGSPENKLKYVEPHGSATIESNVSQEQQPENVATAEPTKSNSLSVGEEILSGKVNRLGEYIDTDAVCLHVYFWRLI